MTHISAEGWPGQHELRRLQGVWMKVDITKKEYRTLLDMLGIANWVLHAHREEDAPRTAAYRELEQKFFKLAADFGLADSFEYDEDEGRYYPTAEFEEEGPLPGFMDEYNDGTFWKELVERLAMRDVLSHIGQKEFHDLEVEERLHKLDDAIEVYEDEFAKNGLNRLAIDI
jgi:hypothetical protein